MPSFGTAVRLNKIPVVGLVPETSGSAPADPRDGQLWVDTSGATPKLKVWDGDANAWVPFDRAQSYGAGTVTTGALADQSVTADKIADGLPLSKLAINPLDRTNHTGTQPAATISDLASVVQGYRLDEFAVPNGPLALNGQKLSNVGTPTVATDAATRGYVDTAVSALVDAAPGVLDTLRELAAALGNDPNFAATLSAQVGALATRIDALEQAPSVGAGNGLVKIGDEINVALDADADNPLVVTPDSIGFGTVAVTKGGTGGTTPAAARTNLGVAQRGYAADVPAITAGGTATITHGLGTQDVLVQVRNTATNDVEYIGVTMATPNTVVLSADIDYAAGALRVTVLPVA